MGSGEANATAQLDTVDRAPECSSDGTLSTVAQFRACGNPGGCSAGDAHALSGAQTTIQCGWYRGTRWWPIASGSRRNCRDGAARLTRSVACFVKTDGTSCCRVSSSGSGRHAAPRGESGPWERDKIGRTRASYLSREYGASVQLSSRGHASRASSTRQVTSLSGSKMTGTTSSKLRGRWIGSPPG